MPLLLDTHVLLALFDDKAAGLDSELVAALGTDGCAVSIASLWEIANKVRQNKLALAIPVSDMELEIGRLGCAVLPILAAHVVAEVTPWPDTNDPFDRLLLAVCAVERLRLVTRDGKLVDHPLAWRGRPA